MLMTVAKDQPGRQASPEPIRWLILRVETRAEWHVRKALHGRGIEAFYPTVLLPFRRFRWEQRMIGPLFPGYLFAAIPLGLDTEELRKVPGFNGVLKNTGKAVVVPKREIDKLRRRAHRSYLESWGTPAKLIQLNPGDWVAVPDGPLKGVPVLIDSIDNYGYIRASFGNAPVTFHKSRLTERVAVSAAQ